jgi:DNA-binding FadR family transcriptional regulator
MSGQAMLQTEPGEAEGHRPDLAARIAAWLEGAILGRALAPGAKLPTEGMLVRQLGVSRAVVREAIARVKSDGLAQSRQGSGLHVTDPFERRSFRFDEELAQDEARMLGFFELRQPVEIAAAHFAAARRTDEDMARIVAALEAMTAAEDWSEDGVRADLRFHPAIAVATQNRYYADFLAFLGAAIWSSMRLARADRNRTAAEAITLREHHRILDAIDARDSGAAERAMHAHLAGARARIRVT